MIEVKTLSCGVKLVMEKIPQYQSASIGIWVGAGSARENDRNNGVSHYIEHLFFKGTESRTQLQIARDTDDLGCDMNAFTGKEATCFHIKALTGVFPQAVDILLDMLCNSLFAQEDIERERGVILEEYSMTCDTPDEYIMDLLDEKVFGSHPLARPVLGTKETIESLGREDLLSYIRTWYARDNIVVSVVGNFDEERLSMQLEEKLSSFGEHSPAKDTCSPFGERRFVSLKREINQTHLLPEEILSDQSVDIATEIPIGNSFLYFRIPVHFHKLFSEFEIMNRSDHVIVSVCRFLTVVILFDPEQNPYSVSVFFRQSADGSAVIRNSVLFHTVTFIKPGIGMVGKADRVHPAPHSLPDNFLRSILPIGKCGVNMKITHHVIFSCLIL